MKYLLLIALAIALTGCASMFGPSKSSRVHYSMNNADRLTLSQRVAIQEGKIKQGMTKDDVRAAWGDPCGYCGGSTHNSYGDTWEYNIFGTGSAGAGDGTYVYFSPSGRVTGWSSP